jgi:hypothetical protein
MPHRSSRGSMRPRTAGPSSRSPRSSRRRDAPAWQPGRWASRSWSTSFAHRSCASSPRAAPPASRCTCCRPLSGRRHDGQTIRTRRAPRSRRRYRWSYGSSGETLISGATLSEDGISLAVVGQTCAELRSGGAPPSLSIEMTLAIEVGNPTPEPVGVHPERMMLLAPGAVAPRFLKRADGEPMACHGRHHGALHSPVRRARGQMLAGDAARFGLRPRVAGTEGGLVGRSLRSSQWPGKLAVNTTDCAERDASP